MAKILHFPIPESESTIEEFLKETAEIAKSDEAICAVVACKLPDGSWITGYKNADWGTRNEAMGHIQSDIIDQMILSNLDRYCDI